MGSSKKGGDVLRGPKAVKFQYIADYSGCLTRSHLCRLMEVTERGFRAWKHRPPSHRQRRDMVLLAHIRDQHRLSLGSYGRPRMTEELNELGLGVGRRRVGRLMRQNGIQVVRTRKFKATTDRCPAGDCNAIGREGAITPSTSRRISCNRTSLRAGQTRNALSWFAGKPLPGNRRATSPMSGRGRVGSIWLSSLIFSQGVWLAGPSATA